jgi:hypothetical protein
VSELKSDHSNDRAREISFILPVLADKLVALKARRERLGLPEQPAAYTPTSPVTEATSS